jgi:carbonic anhydrase/acetyltransferase-like protein (isoleucine patch superfamily)
MKKGGFKNRLSIELLITFVIIVNISTVGASNYNTGSYPGNSFIDPSVQINVSDFSIGSESYIGPFTSFTGEYAHIGSYSDFQDGVSNSGTINIKDDAVVAHGAHLEGDIEIGSHAFIGFNSYIKDAKIGDDAYIGIGSKIIGIDIPPGKSVPQAAVIDSADDIEKLEEVTKEQEEFVQEVIGVNRVLAIGYTRLFENSGESAFGKVGPNGDGDILLDGKDILSRSGSNEPVIGAGSVIESARIIGDVFLGENSKVESGTSIRADEGIPITIGKNAMIGMNNTFHSLNDQEIIIGNDLNLGSDSVLHGQLILGDNVRIGNNAVVFKSTIGNNVDVGDNAIVVGVKVPDGTVIPPGSVLATKKDVRMLNPNDVAPGTKWASITNLFSVAMIPIVLGFAISVILRKKEH